VGQFGISNTHNVTYTNVACHWVGYVDSNVQNEKVSVYKNRNNTFLHYFSPDNGQRSKNLRYIFKQKHKEMKSYILLSVVLFGLRLVSYSQTQCQFSFGSPIHTKQASYYCHQYVKGALLGNMVDMATGLPTSPENNFLTYSGEVATDPNFIQVCVNDAKAIVPSPLGNTAYHSAIKLNDGIFASTPDASSQSIYSHQSATAFTTACPQDVQYYATIPNVTISGTSATNQGM